MGAFVGRTAVKDGKGVMVDWRYADGKDYQPSDDAVRKLRREPRRATELTYIFAGIVPGRPRRRIARAET